MNKRFTLVSLAIVLGICAFIYFTQTQVITANSSAVQAQSAYGVRAVKNVRVQNYNALGENVSYYDKVPQRVIAVGEQINETLVALGVEQNVICPVRYGNPFYTPEPQYAEEYNKIKFQDNVVLNMENVLSMQPDLIISGQVLYADKKLKSTDFWNKRGIHTYVSTNANSPTSHNKKETLEQEWDFILGLGTIFDKETEAKKIVADMQQDIAAVREKTQSLPKPKVMIIEMLGKNIVAYDDSKLAGDICVKLGAQVPSFTSGTIGLETIIEENPDVLFVVKSGGNPEEAADFFRKHPGLKSLRVVQAGHVYGISLNYTYNSAIKTGEGIKKFAKGIYPELF